MSILSLTNMKITKNKCRLDTLKYKQLEIALNRAKLPSPKKTVKTRQTFAF